MLTFVYSGAVSFLNDEDCSRAKAVMKLAHEWNMPELFQHAEAKCTLSLSLQNLPAMMTEAQLYGAKVLKNQCTNFVRDNLTQVVLAHPHLTSTLASDYPELWSELSDQLGPAQKRRRIT